MTAKPVIMVSNGGANNPRGAWTINSTSWTTENMPTFGNGSGSSWADICYSPSLDTWIAVSNSGSNNNNSLAISTDAGVTWTGVSIPEANNTWNSVCWAAALGLFVAVSEDGTHRVITSPNGTTWTVQTAASASAWKSVCWSPDLGMLCAVGSSNAIMTSTNGTAWTTQTGPGTSKNWQAIVWAAGTIQKFVSIALSGGGANDEMYSSNGTSWTQQTVGPGSGYSWRDIAYSVDLDMLIVVGGNTGVFNRSTNATSWTEVSSGIGGTPFIGAAWSRDLALWFLVGNGTTYTSPNGTAWTSQTTPSGGWVSVEAGYTPAPTEIDIPASTHALGVSMAAVIDSGLHATPSLGIAVAATITGISAAHKQPIVVVIT